MFLDWINEINLLSHNPETNILSKFPYSTKRILIYEITNCFIKQNGKTINTNLNSYINNSESVNIIIPTVNSVNLNNGNSNSNNSTTTNNNNNNNNNNTAINKKKSGPITNGLLTTSPVIESAISTSIDNEDVNISENLLNINLIDNTDNKSQNNKSINSNLSVPLEIDTNIKSSKYSGSINENNSTITDNLNRENTNSTWTYSSPCTEAFISFPKIEPNIPWTWLTSVRHVHWVMEIIGQGFALPPTEENVIIIRNACAIYTQWLLDPTERPYIIQAKERTPIEQIFWQKIFHHFSLLFFIDEKTTIYHQELCKQVLSVILMAERTLGNKFSEETWIILLKVLLGISDYLLREPLGKLNQNFINSSIMADKLCEHIIRVLIESWLRSQTKRTDMWESLKKYFKNWTHRIGVVEQWNATIYGLTQKVLNILYGQNYGKNNVNIVVNGYIISLDLSSDFVIYSWAQMLYIMGDITSLSPNNFNSFLTGISNVVDLFHSIDNKLYDEDFINGSSPDGNTILNLFSSFLFKALSITKDNKEYNKGKAIAFSILCKIIVKPQIRLPIHQIYLDRSYTLISQGLNSDFLSVTSIIRNSQTLFQQELKGSRLLFPDYILSIFKFLPKIFSCNLVKMEAPNPEEDFDSLRLSCYVILSHIYSYPNHFYEIPIREELQNNDIINGKKAFMSESIHTNCFNIYKNLKNSNNKLLFGSLKPVILEILLASIQYEMNEDNLNFLLYLIYCFTYNDIKNTKGLLKITNDSITNTLILNKDYSIKLIKDALDTLLDLSSLQSFDTEYEPYDLIMKFCAYIDIILMEDNVVSYQYNICTLYEIITNWIINGAWITKYKHCLNCVILILSKGIYFSNKQNFINMPKVVNLINKEGKEILDESLSEFIQRKLRERNNIILNLPNSKINSKDGISTSTEDGGVGIPTFAILSTALMIEKESEVCLNIILNYLGYFPLYGNNTRICNIGSLWNEENELIDIIKLKYNDNNKLQLQSKENDEIIQLFLEQENDDNIIQYFSLYDELIIGVLSLPIWYINIKKNKYIENFRPVVKSKSAKSDGPKDKPICTLNKSNSEVVLKSNLQKENLVINTSGVSPFELDSKECTSPENAILFEFDNSNLKSYPLEKNRSNTSLYGTYTLSPSKDKTSNSNENNPTSDISENNPIDTSEADKLNEKILDLPYMTSPPPKIQSNINYKENLHTHSGIKSIDNKKLDDFINNIPINSLNQEELKDKFVVYIVRNCTGKFTWISSLKYENNNKFNDIVKSMINVIKPTLISNDKEGPKWYNSNRSPKYCNSTSNINTNMKLNDEELTELKKRNNKNNKNFEIENEEKNDNDLQNLCNCEETEKKEMNKDFKIFNSVCFNESELPSNQDIINNQNNKYYYNIKKISEILSNTEEKVLKNQNQNDKEYKRINKIEIPKCKDLNDSEEKDTNIRLHLIHNNFISLENYNSLIPLKKSVNLFKDLNDLDNISSRERFTYSVFYVPNEDSTIDEIFKPKFINKNFKSFIYSMCWLVNPKSHTGFLGGFTNNSKQNIPYYADRRVEMILHIPYFIDDNEFNQIESSKNETPANKETFIDGFKEFTKNNNVFIIWMGKNNINAYKVLNNLYKNDIIAKMYYIIYPYDYTKGLYKINIIKARPSKLINAIKMKNRKKSEVEKSKVLSNSKSFDIFETSNKYNKNDFENKTKNLKKVNEEEIDESINSANETNGNINVQEVANNPDINTNTSNNTSNNNNNTNNTNYNNNNNLSQYNFDDMDYNRKSSYASYSSTTDSSRKSIPNQPTKITFHPVLIENKVNKRQSLIANKDSQGVYIPKSDKPKRTIGPLVDGMIVQQNSLGHLIRKSILNYSLDKITVYSRSISQRKKIIKTLCTNYQNNSTLSEYYSSLI